MMNMSRIRNLRNSNVRKFDNNRKLPFNFGGKEKGEGKSNRPWGIYLDSDNNIYEANKIIILFKNLIQKIIYI